MPSQTEPRTEWTPLVRGGEGLSTHRLVPFEGGLWMRKSLGSVYLGGLGLALGGALIGVGLVAATREPTAGSGIALFLGLVFLAGGLLYLVPKGARFDERRRLVSLGRQQVPFSNIAALQLVRELVDGDETTFMSWELNLVLRDGSRLNVIDHAGGAQLREEATRLGQLIGCPVWEREAQPPSAASA